MGHGLRSLEEIGKLCRKARKNAGLYQFQVGEMTGYTPNNISMFERGKVSNLLLFVWYYDNLFSLDLVKEFHEGGV